MTTPGEDSHVFSCTVHGRIVPQGRPRVRMQPFPSVYYPKDSGRYRELLTWEFRRARRRALTVSAPCRVAVVCYGMKATIDLDNVAKQVLDAMVTARVLKGDHSEIVRELVVTAAGPIFPGKETLTVDVFVMEPKGAAEEVEAVGEGGEALDGTRS